MMPETFPDLPPQEPTDEPDRTVFRLGAIAADYHQTYTRARQLAGAYQAMLPALRGLVLLVDARPEWSQGLGWIEDQQALEKARYVLEQHDPDYQRPKD